MLKCILVCLLIFASVCAFAQPNPPVRWQRRYEPGDRGVTVTMAAAPDNCFVLAEGNRVTRIDSNGTILWSRQYHVGPICDTSACIAAVGDDGFIVCGGTCTDTVPNGDWRYSKPYLLRLADNGDSLWAYVYGPDSLRRCSSAVQSLADGSFLMAVPPWFGAISSGIWRVDNDGNIVWQRSYGTWWVPRFRSMPDGGFVIPCRANQRLHILKLDAVGDSVSTFRVPGNLDFYDVLSLEDGFAIYGYIDENYALVRTSLTGDSLWTHIYPSVRPPDLPPDEMTAIACPDDGFALVCDSSVTSPRYQDFLYLIRTDSHGDVLWTQAFTDSLSSGAWGAFGLPTEDHGYVISGISLVDGRTPFVIRTGPDMTLDSPFPLSPYPLALSLSAYPNPFNPTATISFNLPRTEVVTLTVYDIIGQQVQTLTDQRYEAGEHSLLFDGSHLSSGIYFARLQAGSITRTQKLMLMR